MKPIAAIIVLGDGDRMIVGDIRLEQADALADALGLTRDTPPETLIYAAWQRWDEGALVRFDGDYAIAVRDPARGEMVLARDPVGQRP
ncbi:MAG: hypothetical protein ACTHJR_02785, partial [Sphingomonas sp.]|uniref:hypothetical protein n=1 Tax=Sphingomonas sp. TaxID=28214 RepID=UPI003F80B161